MDGILLVDKPSTITTRHIDNDLKHIYGTKKVGHAGTLDPFATGLVLVGINRGTKILSLFENMDKTYVATLKLGYKTASGDLDTPILESADVPELNSDIVRTVLTSFVGEQTQVPPMYSAIKIDGKPLYKMARDGQEIERKSRTINIYSIELLNYDQKDMTISFICRVSKGTYIRTLGEDIAIKLGTLGYLTELRRVKIGEFTTDQSVKLEDINTDTKLISIPDACYFLPHIEVDEDQYFKVKNGIEIELDNDEESVLFTKDGMALAIYEKKIGGTYKCRRGLM